MTRLPRIVDLEAASNGWGFFLCARKEVRSGRSGDYLALRLQDASGEIDARITDGFAALKTIAAYRGGLDRIPAHIVAALAANDATGRPLPVQVHCGFGDSDLWLPRADPGWLKPLVARAGAVINGTDACNDADRESAAPQTAVDALMAR